MGWTVARWESEPSFVHGFGGRDEPGPPGVTTLRQVHGQLVRVVGEVVPGNEGDGLVCASPGDLAGVWTADCVPLLLLAPRRRVAAVVHSGWRGTVAGIVDEALAKLRDAHGIALEAVEAALGPSIGGCCYEVGEEVREAFRAAEKGESGFSTHGGRLHLDLREVLEAQLHEAGVIQVERVGPCTACKTDQLFSSRKEGKTGRQLSFVGWYSG